MPPRSPCSPPAGVQLVVEVLRSCGGYFTRGAAAARLDRFLPAFLRYLAWKVPLPPLLEAAVRDMLDELRPRFVRPASVAEAEALAARVEWAEACAAAEAAAQRRAAEAAAGVVRGRTGAGGQQQRAGTDDDSSSGGEDDDEEDEEEDDEEEGDDGNVDESGAGAEEDIAAAGKAEPDADADYDRAAAAGADAGGLRSKEDAEFDAEMRRLVADSVDQQRRQQLRVSADRMVLPVILQQPSLPARRGGGAGTKGRGRHRGGLRGIASVQHPLRGVAEGENEDDDEEEDAGDAGDGGEASATAAGSGQMVQLTMLRRRQRGGATGSTVSQCARGW